MIKPLTTAVILLLPLTGYAADDVHVLKAGEEASCRLVTQDVCNSTSMKPAEVCLEWHNKMAKKASADAMIMHEGKESRRTRPTLSGMKSIVTTSIAADYYDCGFAAQQNNGMMMQHHQPVESEDYYEQRLQNIQHLKEKGLITEKEYQQKRQQILDEL